MSEQPSIAPNTTAQQDLTTAGQRHINAIWEYTQAFLAITVVSANVLVWVVSSIKGSIDRIPEGLVGLCGMVIGFYFARTNHQAIGGTGAKPSQPYEGR
jgi:hypothetical protein